MICSLLALVSVLLLGVRAYGVTVALHAISEKHDPLVPMYGV